MNNTLVRPASPPRWLCSAAEPLITPCALLLLAELRANADATAAFWLMSG